MNEMRMEIGTWVDEKRISEKKTYVLLNIHALAISLINPRSVRIFVSRIRFRFGE